MCDTNLFSGNFDDDIFYIKDGLNTCWNNTKLPDDKSSGEKVFDRREEKGDGVELDHEELIHENLDDNESEHKEPNSSRPGDISNNDRAIPKKGRKLAEFSPPNDVVVQEVLVTPELGGEDATSCKRTRISE